ncbi:uncharacterized protein LOC111358122 isoform X1 [Spodoptera litura]|uniref:Uncharacterized protein LOC111358122 isoform X1 n=1 Tax=Spodoptera litura TaxID=69820 RepID=A0A9J7EJH7_SPOLT|nr:uncharacterized protein LOC111358122 isoform X1 [Spodoptera litura]XP_022828805.1 uncharacterized protein LOC111358122 isoform X1 [Spodoptera litura]
MWFLLLLLLPGVRLQEDEDNLSSKDNPYRLPFNAVQFVDHKTSKNGPILFPNDAPPPPPTPLIVTSRPLIESIARSELNPNNSVAAQSQYHQVQFRPDYLTRTRSYKPFAYGGPSTPVYDYRPPNVGYIATTERPEQENFYREYEKHLMDSLQPRKNETKGVNLWERPIYRRRIEQSPRINNPRKANFDDEVKSKQIKVYHSSLYSREADYNHQVADHHENQDEHNNMIESDESDSLRQKRATMEDDDSKPPFFNINKKSINRKIYSNAKEIQAKSLLSVKKLNQNDREIFSPTTESKMRNRNRRMDRSNSQEFFSISHEKHSDSSPYVSSKPRANPNQGKQPNKRPTVKLRQLVNIQNHKSNTNQAYNDEVMARGQNNVRKSNKQSSSGEWDRHSENEAIMPKRRPTYKSDSAQYRDKEVNPPPRDDDIKEILSNAQKDKTENFLAKYASLKYRQEEINQQNEDMNKKPKIIRPIQFGNNIQQDQEPAPTPIVGNNKYQDQSPEQLNYDGVPENSKEYNHGDNYAFSYTVKDHKTGDDFSHSQQSTGSATNGEYRVRLPDGRMQIVSYTADENGYNAKVRYDEHSTVDNTVDVDVTKGNIYRPPTPVTYKHIHPLYNDNQDSLENEEYIHQRYNEANIVKSSIAADRPTSAYNNIPHNYYGAKQNDFQNYKQQIETTKPVNKDRVDDLTDTNNEFLKHYHEKLSERNKLQRTKDEDYFKFSQEIADYSSELSHGNDHHKSKFAEFENNEGEPNGKVTPSYEELKELFVGKENRQRNAVSTVRPNDDVTESIVVAITPRKSNLYTNVNYYNNLISATPSPFPYSAHSPTTPSSYLYSTIANLKHRLTFGHKPVLSHQYINKINKYLSFK